MVKNNSSNLNRRLLAVVSIALAIVVAISSFAGPALAYEQTKQSDKPPEIRAKGAIVYSEDLEKVVFSKDVDEKLYPYSITKLMTAYIVAQNLDLNHKVTVHDIDAEPDETQMDLEEGEVLTVEDLLKGLLVESGNDAARMLAKEVAGSEKAFAKMMNKQAKEWGCKNTHFVNASGMYDDKHYTTASDYLIIGRKALANETIHEICTSKKVTIPATNKSDKRIYKNHTTLINKADSGVLGGKTGYWDSTDCSVVLEYSKKDMDLTVVLLGETEENREVDVKVLTAAAHEAVPGYIVAKPGEEAAKLWIKGGKITHVPVYVTEEAYAYPKNGKASSINVKAHLNKGIKAPLKAGQKVGTYDVYTDGKLKATHKLVVKDDVEKGWFTSYLYISNRVVLVILAVIVLLVVLVLKIRHDNLKKRELKRRERNERLNKIMEGTDGYVPRSTTVGNRSKRYKR